MSVRPLRAFISSRIEELAPERAALKQALDEMRIESFVFERDAGARPQSIEDTFLDEVEAADLYIGVFWKGYGRYTIDEYEHADALGMDCLIYEKREGVEDQRDPELAAFLAHLGAVETGLTVKWFYTATGLTESVKDDVARWQAQKVREATFPQGTRLFVDVPRTPPHLIGRDELLLDVVRRLKSGRDVALTGLPGVGKTTFAAAVARHKGVLRHFRDGVLWGSVGPAGNTGRVLGAWCSALSIPIPQQAQPADLAGAVRQAIGSRSLLIVIDDVWQAEAAQLLRVGGPNCVTLLTSRDIGIARSFASSENAVEVAPLEEDMAFALLCRLAPQTCATDEARARATARKLGGLPLALELIAGFLAAPEHSVFRELTESAFDQISDPGQRLQLAFNRLGGGNLQVTLQEAIALSLTGLPHLAIDAFNRLSVFAPKPATFGLEAAKALVGTDARHLALLVARNLLTSIGDDRLELHQVLHDAANAGLVDHKTYHVRHGHYYSGIVSSALRDYTENTEGRIPGSGSALYRREQHQIDAAVLWLMSQEPSNETDDLLVQFADSVQVMPTVAMNDFSRQVRVRRAAISAATRIGRVDAEARLQLFESLYLSLEGRFADLAGQREVSLRHFESAFELAKRVRDVPKNWSSLGSGNLEDVYGRFLGNDHTFMLLSRLATTQRDLGHPQEAVRYGEQLLELARAAGQKDWESTALGILGHLYGTTKQDARALAVLEQRLLLLPGRPAAEDSDRAETLGNLGVFAFRLDRKEDAKRYLAQAMDVATDAKQLGIVRASAALLARLSEQEGKPEEAIQYLVHQRTILHLEMGYQNSEGRKQADILASIFGKAQTSEWTGRMRELYLEEGAILDRIGRLALNRPDPNEAIMVFGLALQVAVGLGDTKSAAVAQANLGQAHERAGDLAKATEAYQGALPLFEQAANWPAYFLAVESLANIHVRAGEYTKAIEHMEAALALAAARGNVDQQFEELERLGSVHAIVAEKSSQIESMQRAIETFERGAQLAVETRNDAKRLLFQANLFKAGVQLALMKRKSGSAPASEA